MRTTSMVLLAVLLVAGCGASEDGTGSGTFAMSRPAAQVTMQCSAFAAVLEVNLAAAEELVPDGYELVVSKSALDGVTDVAQLSLSAMSCSEFTVNGVNYPQGMALWALSIQGPIASEPVPGAWMTLPTQYGYTIHEQVTNEGFKQAVAGYGESATLVKAIDLGGPVAPFRQGGILQLNGRTTTWVEPEVVVSPYPFPLGGNILTWQNVGSAGNTSAHSSVSAGTVSCLEYINGMGPIQGLMHAIILNVEPGSQIGALGFGTQLFGAAMDADLIECTGTILHQ